MHNTFSSIFCVIAVVLAYVFNLRVLSIYFVSHIQINLICAFAFFMSYTLMNLDFSFNYVYWFSEIEFLLHPLNFDVKKSVIKGSYVCTVDLHC
jgi:hypothetical protein